MSTVIERSCFLRDQFSRTVIVASMTWGFVVACAGTEFKTKSKHQTVEGGSGGKTTATGNAAGIGGNGGESGDANAPCGPLRNTPSNYDVELCVEAGSFTMGSDSETVTTTGHVAHSPAHEVTLSLYVIDAYEVTVGRYRACVEAGVCTRPGLNTTTGCTYTETDDAAESLPVSCATAGQATKFCQWDGGRRLPTEAEWERAAAGTKNNVYPWGTSFDCSKAALGALGICKGKYSKPLPVGSFDAGKSALGAYDMAGNVAEWVKDLSGPYTREPVTDPEGPAVGTLRIVRGGSYQSSTADGQTFVRVTLAGATTAVVGFRCARSLVD